MIPQKNYLQILPIQELKIILQVDLVDIIT